MGVVVTRVRCYLAFGSVLVMHDVTGRPSGLDRCRCLLFQFSDNSRMPSRHAPRGGVFLFSFFTIRCIGVASLHFKAGKDHKNELVIQVTSYQRHLQSSVLWDTFLSHNDPTLMNYGVFLFLYPQGNGPDSVLSSMSRTKCRVSVSIIDVN